MGLSSKIDSMAHRETLRKIAMLTFPEYKGSTISITVADHIDRYIEGDATYIDWLVDLSRIEEAGPNGSRDGTRHVLPISTGVPILPGQSVQIAARAQTSDFRCERFMISNSGTPGGAADWIVNDIKIGNRSQFAQSGDIPGSMFATNTVDAFVAFETVRATMDVAVIVTYVGPVEVGVPFFASMVGVMGAVGAVSPHYVRVHQPDAVRREGSSHLKTQLSHTKIPLGFAYVSQRLNRTFIQDTSITIYIPPIDQAVFEVAVDAALAAGRPTQVVVTLIEQALEDRGGLVCDAYVALVVQHASALSAGEAVAPYSSDETAQRAQRSS